jgi:uncharacterized protein (DUF2249 family)
MTISANTKIANLLKHHPGALEAIVGISQKFAKLRNPVLRKLMAGRTSIAMASKLGGCNVEDFFNKLQPLGFEIDRSLELEKEAEKRSVPAFLKNVQPVKTIELDVRPIFETGKDPLSIILQKVKTLEKGYVLKIVNSFEPTPLIHLLGRQGFQTYAEIIGDQLVYTYFYKEGKQSMVTDNKDADYSDGWEEILNRFKGKIESVDVRELSMPLPMHTIMEALRILPAGRALFVYHKRIPVFLLPELEEQKFSYRIKEISDSEVQLLIYKD